MARAAAAKTRSPEQPSRSRSKLSVVTANDKPQYADVGEVAAFAETLPERFLYCRSMGHNWRPLTAVPYRDGGWDCTYRCTRCRTEREQSVSPTGLIMGTKYSHADGYLHEGLGRIVGDGRGALRLESIKRITSKTAV